MESSSYKDFKTSRGITYHYYFHPAVSGKPTLLLSHGFPSTSYDWHHQVFYFKKEGFGLIVPDILGFGETDRPTDVTLYAARKVAQDLVDIVDHEGVQDVIAVGHDWGSVITARFACFYNERFKAFAFLAGAYASPTGKHVDIDPINAQLEKVLGYGPFGYQKFFTADGTPEIIMEHFDSFFSAIWPADPQLWKTDVAPQGKLEEYLLANRVGPLPSYLTEAEASIMKEKLRKGGFAGGVCFYKQFRDQISADDEKDKCDPAGTSIEKPTFFGAALLDYVCIASINKTLTTTYCKNVKIVDFETDHWIMLAAPDKLNKELHEWVDEVMKS